ncbi:MAG: LacI family DNA-binding transcriptional regulator [bacterium]|nr:LacI family DNA-binding transcriptional regulator [bacterium]
MATKVTLATIAEAVGVSRMTVSNAYSRPDQLSADLRERILATAADLGYCGPDPVARAQSLGRTDTIGVLFTDRLTYAFTDEFAGRFLSGVASVVEQAGLALSVLSSPRDELVDAGAVATAMIDGLIVYSVDKHSPGLAAARRRNLPLVFADQAPEPAIASVLVDDRGGARAAAKYLRDLGHTEVAMVTGAIDAPIGIVEINSPPAHHVAGERLAGWREGLGEPIVENSVLVNVPWNRREHGREAVGQVLDGGFTPTAYLCLTDLIALGVIDGLRERGLRVPEDVSVIGFDDSTAAQTSVPPLTTVRQPQVAKGQSAALLLMQRLGIDLPSSMTPPVLTDGSVLLDTELIVRDSTARIGESHV